METNEWKSVGIKPKLPGDDEGMTDDETGGDLDLEQIARDQIGRLILTTL